MIDMKDLLKQSVGIDVSKDTLDVAMSVLSKEFQVKVVSTTQLKNNTTGIKKLISWIHKHSLTDDLPLQVVLEATGVYHELVTHNLDKRGFQVVVVMPNKVKNYVLSTDIRTITDKISAKQIAEFGLVKKLKKWKKPDSILRTIKVLSRERLQLINDRTRSKNQMHALIHSVEIPQASIKRVQERIKFLDNQIKEIEQQILSIVQENRWLKDKIDKIISVKGIGIMTVVTVISETDGFNLMRNTRQLVCYAGYDVVHKESGTSVKRKGKMSHRGNKYIRRALHFPSLSAVQHEEYFTNFYNRLYDRQKIKMKSYVAVQRKLLILIYTLWKNNEVYMPKDM